MRSYERHMASIYKIGGKNGGAGEWRGARFPHDGRWRSCAPVLSSGRARLSAPADDFPLTITLPGRMSRNGPCISGEDEAER